MHTSLREQVLQYCASSEDELGAQVLDQGELLNYLQQIADTRQPPLDSVLAQAEAIGDPALPTREQSAILRWLESAFKLWEQDYPLEEPIANQLRQLKPLIATLAITDPSFLQPGTHPAHQLLDTAQTSAIGWQERLGRAGEQLQRHISAMSETALQNFSLGNTDLTEQLDELQKFAARDRAKLQRLEERLVATDEGQTKTAQARIQAARMINTGLRKYPATSEIGELIKGPWYASAQLVMLKFGAESPQWKQVAQTTEALLQSVNIQENENSSRQHLFEVATQLPKSIKRWLMSLHHDSDTLDDAVAVIESAHMQLMRNQELDLREIDIIPETTPTEADTHEDEGSLLALAALDRGQWFLIETAKGSLRAQLVLKKSQEQQLLFANQAGIKTLMLDFREFTTMLTQAQAIPLQSGASFSMSLARAAGLTATDKLTAEDNTAQQTPPEAEEQPREQEQREQEQRQREQEQREQEQQQREQEQREQEQRQREQEQREQEQRQREQEQREQEQRQREQEQREQEQRQREQEQREQEQRQREQEQREQEQRQREQEQREQEQRQREQEQRDERAAELSLPMGAWLQFLDGDSPLLAKLALQRREDDVYIFVDRKGVKLRELHRESLRALMNDKLVDILDAGASLQERVDRVRDKLRARGVASGRDTEPQAPDEYTAGEKRQHPRFTLERTAFIELLAADAGSEGGSAGEVVDCYTVDASRGGLRVRIHHPLTAGSILQIAVDVADDDTLYLAAEVRWCELGPISGQGWIAGFILMDAVDSGLDSWLQLLSTLETKAVD